MRRARRAVVFVTAALIALVGAVAPAGAGKFGDVVAAGPAPGSTISAGHFYLLPAHPGDTFTQNLRVTNPNDHAVTVMVEAVDAVTGELTGVQLGKPGSAKALTSRSGLRSFWGGVHIFPSTRPKHHILYPYKT